MRRLCPGFNELHTARSHCVAPPQAVSIDNVSQVELTVFYQTAPTGGDRGQTETQTATDSQTASNTQDTKMCQKISGQLHKHHKGGTTCPKLSVCNSEKPAAACLSLQTELRDC